MKQIKYAALLSMLTLLSSMSALARDKNQHSVQISSAVQIGGKEPARRYRRISCVMEKLLPRHLER